MRKLTNISDDQDAHMNQILYYFAPIYRQKYERGAIEHNSNLWEFSDDELLEFALEEVLDLTSYIVTIIQNRKKRDGRGKG